MSPVEKYTCEDAFRRLDDYVDRTLSPEERERVEAHLLECAVCAREYRFETTFVEEVRGKLRRIMAPVDLLERIVTRLEGNG